jgi:hypothetical protein
LDIAYVASLKLEKNMIATKKVHPSSYCLFDLQGRSPPEPKKEGNETDEVPTKFVNLLQYFSNKMVRIEKNLQNQHTASGNHCTFQSNNPPPPYKRPFQLEKQVET